MEKWELAKYLIDAKTDIDSILFIKMNYNEISNIELYKKVESIQVDFYIKLCIILENTICKTKKKEVCAEHKVIDDIYYERDKDKAHKDKSYIRKRNASYNEIIKQMKREIETVKELTGSYLPEIITLDYVPHDKELFRLKFGINRIEEEKINDAKYIRSQIKEINKIEKNVINEIDEIRSIPENRKKEYAVIVKNGINMFEGIQNRQEACIKINMLDGQNCWTSINHNMLEKWIELKNEGFIDNYDRPVFIIRWSNAKIKELDCILNMV